MTIYALEGIDYSGKSTTAQFMISKHGMIHHALLLSKEEKDSINNLPIEERFKSYLQLNEELYPLAKQHKPSDRVLLERCWFSTLAYHNIYLQKRFEEEKDIYRRISDMRLDTVFFVMTNEEAIKERMQKRKPAHKFETDIYQLLNVQDEYLRLMQKICPEMGMRCSIIDNHTNSKAELEKIVGNLRLE